ncbi:MAG TPA: hypothetical protein VFY68_06010 [Nitrososphaeraceae archaeon]|nr:hypothetical protein [Nitrososphaeraceae archaeon]
MTYLYPPEDHPASCTYYQNDHKANKLAELVQMIEGTKAAFSVTIARIYPNVNVNM